MSFFKTLKQGQDYYKTWPKIKVLTLIFPENRVINATTFAIKIMPFFAVFSLFWQQIYAPHNQTALAIALITSITALSIPLQGFYWLGKRSQRPLPWVTQQWFEKIAQQLEKDHHAIIIKNAPTPTYQDLALLLQQAQKKFPADFWQEI